MMDENRIASTDVGSGGVIRKCFLAGAATGLFFTGVPVQATGDCPVNYAGLKTAVQAAAAADSSGAGKSQLPRPLPPTA